MKQLRSTIPPASDAIESEAAAEELENVVPGNKTGIAASLHQVAEQIKRRGLVIILSDFFDDPANVITAFKHFRHKGNEVIVMQVLDPLERSFAFGTDAIFRDIESQEELMTQPWHIQKAYQDSMRQFLENYKRECRENAIDYLLLDTSTPFDKALMEYLTKRRRLG